MVAQPQGIRAAAAEVLDGAARYIEAGWCRFSTARSGDNVPCAPTSTDAVCWCASGAIHVAARRSAPPQLLGTVTEQAQHAMVDAILETHPDFFDPGTLPMSVIASWNDHAEIGPEHVTERLRRGAELLRLPGGGMKVAIRDGMSLQLSREPARFTREPRRVLVYRQGDRRAVVWRSDLLLMGRHRRPYTVMLLREDGGDCRTESHRTVPAALDTARGWVTGAIAE